MLGLVVDLVLVVDVASFGCEESVEFVLVQELPGCHDAAAGAFGGGSGFGVGGCDLLVCDAGDGFVVDGGGTVVETDGCVGTATLFLSSVSPLRRAKNSTRAQTSAATANGSVRGSGPHPPGPVPPPPLPVGSGSGPTGTAPVSSGFQGGS